MRLTMVGTGYVGLVTGVCFSNTGNDVTCLDVDARKIEKLRQGICPIYEPGLEDLMEHNTKAGRLRYTLDKAEAYRDAEMIFICVGTPSDERGHTDLKYVNGAADDIADVLKTLGPKQKPKVIVMKSTVPVGTTLAVRDRIRARVGPEIPFKVADNPEFLKEGDAISDFNKPDRVVVGVEDEATGEAFRQLYDPFVRNGHPIFVMDILSAEMVKYASNNFLATKISFINEMANLCEAYGADIQKVREGMCSDKRIGNQFLYPGLGYGGSCFPKDTLACIMMGDKCGIEARLSKSVHEVNQKQRDRFFDKIVAHFGGKTGVGGGPAGQEDRLLGHRLQAQDRRHPRGPGPHSHPQGRVVRRFGGRVRSGRQRERTGRAWPRGDHRGRHVRGREGRRCPCHLDRLGRVQEP